MGAADLTVSADGTLLYGTGGAEGQYELVWVTRDGKTQPVDPDWAGNFWGPSISPDGKQVALGLTTLNGATELWAKQLDRGPSIKLTSDENDSEQPTWTPDGRSVTFSARNGPENSVLWTRRADGSGEPALQFRPKTLAYDTHWSPDKSWLIYTAQAPVTPTDIVGLRPGTDSAPVSLIATKYFEFTPTLSPDGKWMAYVSDESGRYEIYVVPFPNTGSARWAISTHGGTAPVWSRRINELFYRDLANNLVSVEVKTAPTFSVVSSVALFSMAAFRNSGVIAQYAVSSDNRRFLMLRPLTLAVADKLIVVENWLEELKRTSRR